MTTYTCKFSGSSKSVLEKSLEEIAQWTKAGYKVTEKKVRRNADGEFTAEIQFQKKSANKTENADRLQKIVGYVCNLKDTGKVHKKLGCHGAKIPITLKQKHMREKRGGTFCSRCSK